LEGEGATVGKRSADEGIPTGTPGRSSESHRPLVEETTYEWLYRSQVICATGVCRGIMGELQWRVGVCEPDALPPDSTVELVLQYTNRNDYPHHVQSASLARTWDSSHVSHHSVDREIAPGATERLAPIRLTTPRGIGGNQGVRIGFDVGEATDRETTDYERKWGEAPLRLDVPGAAEYRPVYCVSGSGDDSAVRRLVHDWGFDVREVHDPEGVVDAFEATETTPIAVFGVVLPSGDGASSRGLVSSAATAARNENRIPLVFRHEGMEDAAMPDLPDQCIVIEFDPDDEPRLEEAAGRVLLGIRHLEEAGRTNRFVGIVSQYIDESREKAAKASRRAGQELRNAPKQLLWAWVGHVVLSATGADEATDDLIEEFQERTSKVVASERPPESPTRGQDRQQKEKSHAELSSESTAALGGWPLFRADAANTGHAPDETGPTWIARQRWRVETGSPVRSSPAVVDGTVYVGSDDNNVYALTE